MHFIVVYLSIGLTLLHLIHLTCFCFVMYSFVCIIPGLTYCDNDEIKVPLFSICLDIHIVLEFISIDVAKLSVEIASFIVASIKSRERIAAYFFIVYDVISQS